MGRPKKEDVKPIASDKIEDETKNPETAKQDDGSDAVKDIPPANPFDEPLAKEYPEGKNAEVNQATLKPSETIVEHPLAPTDANPNPHGNRDDPETAVAVKDKDGNVETHNTGKGAGGDTEIEATADEVHLGDGRVLRKGEKAKVHKDVAGDENMKGKIKRV